MAGEERKKENLKKEKVSEKEGQIKLNESHIK